MALKLALQYGFLICIGCSVYGIGEGTRWSKNQARDLDTRAKLSWYLKVAEPWAPAEWRCTCQTITINRRKSFGACNPPSFPLFIRGLLAADKGFAASEKWGSCMSSQVNAEIGAISLWLANEVRYKGWPICHWPQGKHIHLKGNHSNWEGEDSNAMRWDAEFSAFVSPPPLCLLEQSESVPLFHLLTKPVFKPSTISLMCFPN